MLDRLFSHKELPLWEAEDAARPVIGSDDYFMPLLMMIDRNPIFDQKSNRLDCCGEALVLLALPFFLGAGFGFSSGIGSGSV